MTADPATRPDELAALSRLTETQADQIAQASRAAILAEARAESLTAAAADRHVLRATLRALQRRLDEMTERQSGRDAALAGQLLDDAARLEAFQARVVSLTQDVQAAQAETRALRGSTSWRLTAPLRALIMRFRRG